mgnify:FL=1|tara:strand:- start:80 stop:520 length:441 start_codon:yes stop_codon:yes gene_type:complete
MAKVFEIAITQNFKGKMETVNNINIIAGKGIMGDRYFKENNDKKNQITLIEKENIDYFNKLNNTQIKSVEFRRNIITEEVRLNELVGKVFSLGNVKLKGIDLCRPCKNLQETLKQKNLIKEFLRKGGLRCEIIKDGKISVGDEIKF